MVLGASRMARCCALIYPGPLRHAAQDNYASYNIANGDFYGQVWSLMVRAGSLLLQSMNVSVFKLKQWCTPKAKCQLRGSELSQICRRLICVDTG